MALPPLQLSSSLVLIGQDPKSLRRLNGAGLLTRVRRGAYVDTKAWKTLDDWDRHRLQAVAHAATALQRPRFARHTSAVLWGLPLRSIPADLQALHGRPGGGRSRHGVVRYLAQPHHNIIEHGGLAVTDPPSTLLDLADRLPFEDAVMAWEYCLNPARSGSSTVTHASMQAEITRLGPRPMARRCQAVLDISVGNSGSAGESISRANMYLLGFPPPETQHVFRDARGAHLATTDFYWRGNKLIGEFDGRAKYRSEEFRRGQRPEDIVVAEKIREDRLRSQGFGMVRWLWEDAVDRSRLSGILRGAGLDTLPARVPPGEWRPGS